MNCLKKLWILKIIFEKYEIVLVLFWIKSRPPNYKTSHNQVNFAHFYTISEKVYKIQYLNTIRKNPYEIHANHNNNLTQNE